MAEGFDGQWLTVRTLWQWVFEEALPDIQRVNFRSLVSVKSGKIQGDFQPTTFRFERRDRTGHLHCFWSCSPVCHPLRNKDLLVSALEKCGLQWAAPPSLLLPYKLEHLNSATASCWKLPKPIQPPIQMTLGLKSPPAEGVSFLEGRYVLKPPMGCQGDGIEFIGSPEEALPALQHDANLAIENKASQFIGRQPQWVLQSHICSHLLNERKFHLRTHVVIIEKSVENPLRYAVFFHQHHELRIAFKEEHLSSFSERAAHITNGAGGSTTHRCLLSDFAELESLEKVLERWLKIFFSKYQESIEILLGDDKTVIPQSNEHVSFTPWAFVALDLMLDQTGRLWLLEVNQSPGAPSSEVLKGNENFRSHLIQMAKDTFDLIVHSKPTNFTQIL